MQKTRIPDGSQAPRCQKMQYVEGEIDCITQRSNDPATNRPMPLAHATLKKPQVIALSVMLIGALTLAYAGCNAAGVLKRASPANNNRAIATEQKLSVAT